MARLLLGNKKAAFSAEILRRSLKKVCFQSGFHLGTIAGRSSELPVIASFHRRALLWRA